MYRQHIQHYVCSVFFTVILLGALKAQTGPPIQSFSVDSVTRTHAYMSWTLSTPASSAVIEYFTDTGLVATITITPPPRVPLPSNAIVPLDSNALYDFFKLKVNYPDGSSSPTSGGGNGVIVVIEDLYAYSVETCPVSTENGDPVANSPMFVSGLPTCMWFETNEDFCQAISGEIYDKSNGQEVLELWATNTYQNPGNDVHIDDGPCPEFEIYDPYAQNSNNNRSAISLSDRNGLIKVFPNPADQYARIQISDQLEYHTLRLTSLSGQVIQRLSPEVLRAQSNRLDLSELGQGMYIIEVLGLHETRRVKLIKR